MPTVTVIIPTYNRTKQLQAAVASVLSQTYKDFELIVVDDGSTLDITPFVPADLRIKVIRQRHKGVSAARNSGIKEAKGRYIAFLDSDDTWHSEKLARQLAFMQNNPELLISQTQEIWIRNDKRVNPMNKHQKKAGNIFIDSLQLCLISPSAVIIKKELFDEIGLFDEKLPVCEDYDLWLRITARHPVGLLAEPLIVRYAGHDDQLSQKYWGMDRFRIRALKKHLDKSPLVKEVMKSKKRILAAGALKRGNILRWLYYKYM